jgi:hypothetical protein
MIKATIFLSYSHADRPFVERLATDLTLRGITVWYDKWELKVGDSLRDRIQSGLKSSGYLGIVLSPDSVASAWVRVELNAALARELEEGRVHVLPILAQECEIPPFLKDKVYADFRDDYDQGLAELLKRLEPPDTGSRGRTEDRKYYNDYAFDWGKLGDRRQYRLWLLSHGADLPYSVLCTIIAVPSEVHDGRLNQYEEAGFPWAATVMILEELAYLSEAQDARLLIPGEDEGVQKLAFVDPRTGPSLLVEVRARRLGPDPGKDLVYEWGSIVRHIAEEHRHRIEQAVPEHERKAFFSWLRTHRL